jgi:hypothetical protein
MTKTADAALTWADRLPAEIGPFLASPDLPPARLRACRRSDVDRDLAAHDR